MCRWHMFSTYRSGNDIVVTSYEKELWLLEDMMLAVVMCFSVDVVGENMTYSTEFRTYKGPMDGSIGFDICPEDMEEMFLDMCGEQYEWGSRICDSVTDLTGERTRASVPAVKSYYET